MHKDHHHESMYSSERDDLTMDLFFIVIVKDMDAGCGSEDGPLDP